jgi:Uma2 family endonuclease
VVELVMEPFTTFDDFAAWVEHTPENQYYEVVDGLPVMSPSPTPRHQLALSRLLTALAAACPADHVVLPAPLDWVLWEAPLLGVRQPDLMMVSRTAIDGPRLSKPPLLAVEILSPTSFERDLVTKRREYARAGLEHYWIVEADAPQIAVYRRNAETLDLVAHAAGDNEVVIEEPVSLRLRPSDLVR